jgi:hypothetical protein
MKTRNKERYKELSEHAEVEDDPKKLRKITKEIIRILKAEINRWDRSRTSEESKTKPQRRPGPEGRITVHRIRASEFRA